MSQDREEALRVLGEIRQSLRVARVRNQVASSTPVVVEPKVDKRVMQDRAATAEAGVVLLKVAVEDLLDFVMELTSNVDPFSDEYAKIEARTNKARDTLVKVSSLFLSNAP